jgi:hypothetical protein
LPDLGQRMPTTSKRIESKSSEEHSPFSAKTVRPSDLCVLVCGTLLPQADLQSLYLFVLDFAEDESRAIFEDQVYLPVARLVVTLEYRVPFLHKILERQSLAPLAYPS